MTGEDDSADTVAVGALEGFMEFGDCLRVQGVADRGPVQGPHFCRCIPGDLETAH
jgi:hypothetical protein